jgi:methionine-gamma-lyase
MHKTAASMGIGTLVNHYAEGENPHRAHIAPIYQTSLFGFPDVATAAQAFDPQSQTYIYTRRDNPNLRQTARKIAALEGLDLLRREPERDPEELVAGMLFATGMAAISSALLARARTGDVIIAQRSLYSGTYGFLTTITPQLGLQVAWVDENTPQAWQRAMEAHPGAPWVYAETPANPAMDIVDLAMVADLAHQGGSWLIVDNTFATPYCQRPLALGADVVVHSTTKYLVGHGVVVGGAVVSRHVDYIRRNLFRIRLRMGGSPSPFDAWLTNLGLRTFELRMARHCENAARVAEFLNQHPKVKEVRYPGLQDHPGHALAARQMGCFGGMMSFELKGGFDAAVVTLNRVQLATLGVSLGCVDTLIQHPAGMTHANVPREARRKMGISDGLIRLSVGIENAEDIIADLDQALQAA